MDDVRHETNSTADQITRWRWLLIVIATLILCSCRAPQAGGPRSRSAAPPMANGAAAGRSPFNQRALAPQSQPPRPPADNEVMQTAYVAPAEPAEVQPAPIQSAPAQPVVVQTASAPSPAPSELVQVTPAQPFAPPLGPIGRPGCTNCGVGGVAGGGEMYPVPVNFRDEFLCDGGDRERGVVVSPNWSVHGLDIEDTIGHFDTLDGDTRVAPSNQVCVYAPRFAAVRKVYGIAASEGRLSPAGVDRPLRAHDQERRVPPTTAVQQVQAEGQIGKKFPTTFRDRTRGVLVDNVQQLKRLDNLFKPYEDFQVIQFGTLKQDEKARLAESIDAALVWETKQAVQVLIDNKQVALERGLEKPQTADTYERIPGNPRMRVIKVASKRSAQPGDIVEFTIRFDNTGDEAIGNVTIIDNLTTRLEYVPDSAQSNVKADFYTQENEADSLVLRWEVIDPLQPGEGGIVRFQCRVR